MTFHSSRGSERGRSLFALAVAVGCLSMLRASAAGAQDSAKGHAPAVAAKPSAVTQQATAKPIALQLSDVKTDTLPLGAQLTVVVDGLSDSVARGLNPKSLVLFLGGRPIPDDTVELSTPSNELHYRLARTPGSRDAWNAIMGSPGLAERVRKVAVSVGPKGGSVLPVAEAAKKDLGFHLVMYNSWMARAGLVLIVLLTVAYIFVLARSDAIRDPGTAALPAGQRRPYSLARVQIAIWFFLVVTAFLFIWVMTGDVDTITESALALIGLSTVTALGAAAIDANKAQTAAAAAAPQPPLVSKSFWNDVMTDKDGMSFHRFQMLTWTVVLGFLFCIEVYRNLSMPTFNSTLLALQGISGGAYLGFKIPERQQ